MKSPEEVLGQVADRLRRSWTDVVAGDAWSPDFRLGTSGLTGRRLAESWSDTHRGTLHWQEWAATAGEGVSLVTRPATVHGTTQQLPARLHVATIDAAARLAGEEWVARLARARVRRGSPSPTSIPVTSERAVVATTSRRRATSTRWPTLRGWC